MLLERTPRARFALLIPLLLLSTSIRPLEAATSSALDVSGVQSWRAPVTQGFTAASVILDPLRDRLVAFGGEDARGRKTATVWTRSLSRTDPWTPLVVDGAGPAPRMNHSAVFDPVRERMIVYGGWPDLASGSREVWALDLSGVPRWTDLTPTNAGPEYRIGAQMAYDPEHDRLIVVGGHTVDGTAFASDVWALDLTGPSEWVNRSPPEPWPAPREDGVMFYDPPGHRMILFGGCPGSLGMGAHSDVWALSLDDTPQWRELAPGGEPMIGLHSFASAYDPARRRLLVFSGRDSLWSDPPRPETWALELTDPPVWSRLETPAPRPSPRYFSRAVYDATRDRMMLFGGTSDDLWLMTFGAGPAWVEVEPASAGVPAGLFGAAATYDPEGRRTYVHGGESGYYVHGSFYAFASGELLGTRLGDSQRWQSVGRDSAPSPRFGHSMLVDPGGGRLLLFGGAYGELDSSVWQMPLDGSSAWSRLTTAGPTPGPRFFHSAVYDSRRHRMLIYAGSTVSALRGDVWALPLDGPPAWTRLETGGVEPLARSGPVAVYDPVGDRMVVFGGEIGTVALDDTWELSLSGAPHWAPLPTPVRPPARAMAAAAYDPLRRRIVMHGGKGTGSAPLGDLWTFDLAATSGWAPAATAGATPAARWGAAAAFDEAQDLFVVLGGTRSLDPQTFDSNCWLMSSSVPVATSLGVAAVSAHPGHVAIAWLAPGGTVTEATVERRAAFEDWTALEGVVLLEDGVARFEDLGATPGARFGYRLRWKTGNTVRLSDPTWVDVPDLRFALLSAAPNPSASPITLELSLPDGAPARLELIDVAGRRLWHRQVGPLGAGDHSVVIDRVTGLRAGVYLVRLVRGAESRVLRVSVVR